MKNVKQNSLGRRKMIHEDYGQRNGYKHLGKSKPTQQQQPQ